MSWNYRVIRHKAVGAQKTDWLQIHEVFYKGNTHEIVGMTRNAVWIGGADIKELTFALDKMREALEKPILDYEK